MENFYKIRLEEAKVRLTLANDLYDMAWEKEEYALAEEFADDIKYWTEKFAYYKGQLENAV